MRKSRIQASVVGVLAAGLAVTGPGGTALADPGDPAEAFPLTCGTVTYQVTTSDGRGEFTPAFDTQSNKVFVPVRFGTFTGSITGPGFADTFTEERGAVKGSGKHRGAVSCTYMFTETFFLTAEEAVEEGLGGAGQYTFVGSGQVDVQVRGR